MGTTRDTLGTTDDEGVTVGIDRPHTYNDLDEHEKKRFDADIQATNIVLQGIPKDIYKLINHNTEAKTIWNNVKMLLAGSELTKEDHETQLYDKFERFKMIPAAFCSFGLCDLVLHFGFAFCLLKTFLAFCLGETLPILKLDCVLSQDFRCFVSRLPAFCLKTT
nr:integrase, catalytic region, zinc finger, CCHC-type, peptidase aspartic, catalytic [Tanacetum cinerariifolium]